MACKYDHQYKVQAVKLAKQIGGAKAAKEVGIHEGAMVYHQVGVPTATVW